MTRPPRNLHADPDTPALYRPENHYVSRKKRDRGNGQYEASVCQPVYPNKMDLPTNIYGLMKIDACGSCHCFRAYFENTAGDLLGSNEQDVLRNEPALYKRIIEALGWQERRARELKSIELLSNDNC